MDSEIIIYKSRKKAYFIILCGLLLSGASLLSFLYADDNVFGWIFIIASALILILGISNLWDRKPQIILTPTGITDPYAIREEIEWDAIIRADDFFFRGQDILRMLVPSGYKSGMIRPSWFWRLDRLYAQDGLRALYIRVSGLDINSKQLTSIVRGILKTDPALRNDYLRSVKEKY